MSDALVDMFFLCSSAQEGVLFQWFDESRQGLNVGSSKASTSPLSESVLQCNFLKPSGSSTLGISLPVDSPLFQPWW